jgi:peroxiredoxin
MAIKSLFPRQNKVVIDTETSDVTNGFSEQYIPIVEIFWMEDGKMKSTPTHYIFQDIKVVLFAVKGAFNPTCEKQLLEFEAKVDEFKALGIDDVWCCIVNDKHVVDAWAEKLGIKKVKFLIDGNGFFTDAVGMSLSMRNWGMLNRSARYVSYIDNGMFKWFEQDDKSDDSIEDEYIKPTPEVALNYLKRTLTS